MESTTVPAAASASFGAKINTWLAKRPIVLQFFKFAAIGILNTALDFLVLNLISKTFNITSGLRLGQINTIGFVLAVVQSYFWNRYWAFGLQESAVSLLKNFTRLVWVGVLGAFGMALALFGANIGASGAYYLIVLGVYILAEIVSWRVMGLPVPNMSGGFLSWAKGAATPQFLSFVAVSIIGLAINSLLVGVLSSQLLVTANDDLNKNIAKIVATAVSLIWNFFGYKLFVFKR